MTVLALQVPEIFGGAIITEQIFRIPGIGRALIDGIYSIMAEVLLRLFYPQINQHDQMFEYEPLLGWRFTPNKTGSIVYPGEARHYKQILRDFVMPNCREKSSGPRKLWS